MSAGTELRAREMERKADEFAQRARDLEAEAVGYYRPSSYAFYQENARAERYRQRAQKMRQLARQIRAHA